MSARLPVVEDEPDIRELLPVTLRYSGFTVVPEATGSAAVRAVRRHRPDLIVLDVMRPDLDGFDVVRRLVLAALRRKLDEGEPRLIHTLRGFGYVLRLPR